MEHNIHEAPRNCGSVPGDPGPELDGVKLPGSAPPRGGLNFRRVAGADLPGWNAKELS